MALPSPGATTKNPTPGKSITETTTPRFFAFCFLFLLSLSHSISFFFPFSFSLPYTGTSLSLCSSFGLCFRVSPAFARGCVFLKDAGIHFKHGCLLLLPHSDMESLLHVTLVLLDLLHSAVCGKDFLVARAVGYNPGLTPFATWERETAVQIRAVFRTRTFVRRAACERGI